MQSSIRRYFRHMMLAIVLVATIAPVHAQRPPEGSSGWIDKSPVTSRHFMVAAANPLAVEAGYRILKQGGSAVDAAVAVQLVLNLVEPQSSGIGGGAFMLFHDGKRGSLVAYDGRETAPAAARPDRFLDADGKPMGFVAAVIGGRSVGVPGVVALLGEAHRRHGRLPWATLCAPAIKLAEEGFAISPRLATLLAAERHFVQPRAREYFLEADGRPRAAGTILRNPAFARTLRAIAAGGAAVFYRGEIARDVVDTADSFAPNPGDLTLADLANYEVKVRMPVCGAYHAYKICGVPPPSSGGTAVLQMLGMLEPYDVASMGPASFWSVHFFSEAGRLAFADRNVYIADPGFFAVPTGLLDRDYLRERSQLIRRQPRRRAAGRPAHAGAGAQGGVGKGRCARIAVDVAYLDCRCRRQRRRDDDDDRRCVRQPPDDGGRLPAQQPADGFFVRAVRERGAGRQSRRARQAPALGDGTDDRLRPQRSRIHDRRLGRRPCDHQ